MGARSLPLSMLKGRPLGHILIKLGNATPAQVRVALREQKAHAKPLGKLMIDLRFIQQVDLDAALAAQAGEWSNRRDNSPAETRATERAIPAPLHAEQLGDSLRFTSPWFRPARVIYFLTMAGVAAVSGLVVLPSIDWCAEHPRPGSFDPARAKTVSLVVTGICVVGAYASLAGILNRTIVDFSAGRLRIRCRPLPWPGNHTIPIEELDQLYCDQYNLLENVDILDECARADHSPIMRHAVKARTKNGRHFTIVSGLHNAAEASQTAEFLRQRMGICDKPLIDRDERVYTWIWFFGSILVPMYALTIGIAPIVTKEATGAPSARWIGISAVLVGVLRLSFGLFFYLVGLLAVPDTFGRFRSVARVAAAVTVPLGTAMLLWLGVRG